MSVRILIVIVAILGDASALPAGENGGRRDAAPVASHWTSERVRDFVLRLEREMDSLAERQHQPEVKPLPMNVLCREAVSRLRGSVDEPARSCYLATYWGCGPADLIPVTLGAALKPFTRSKVKIIDQSENKVVADIQEIAVEEVENGVAGEWMDTEHPHPYSDKVLATYPDVGSRYTLTKGKDGVWRISDRDPKNWWEWSECRKASGQAARR